MLQSFVEADVGQGPERFELPRDRYTARVLEAHGVTPHDLFLRLPSGAWRAEELRLVLSLSYTPARGFVCTPIDALLARVPPGQLVPLAVLILQAHLFGIEPPAGPVVPA